MAYDGFQQTPNPYSQPENVPSPINFNDPHPPFAPPYPVQYNADQVKMPQPQPPVSAPPPPNQYPDHLREQGAWPPPPPPPAPGRINEAVSSAVGNSGSPGYISPELLTQITANVIQQLRATGFENTPNNQQHPSHQLPQWAPPISTYAHEGSASPPPQTIPQTTSPPPRPIPRPTSYQPSPIPPESFGSPVHLHPGANSTPPQERHESPVSQLSDNSQKVGTRPKPPVRGDTFGNTLEKIWGKLFEDGKPTDRLEQFLRGIATHLIENYPPGNTLVVVPEKLQKFYADTGIPSDPYPWQDIFDDRTSSISRLFREVEAEHHLVQDKLHERPDIPGLTPRGFQVWATLMIQAHPEKEYERLQKAVLHMPISNPDNTKERFPKEIPRRLFPEAPNLILREEIDQFIMKHCGVDLPRITEDEIKKAAVHRVKASTTPNITTGEPIPSITEREPKPHHISTSAIIDDDDEEASSHPIERKRKPYSAHPGGGKVYNEPGTPKHRHANSFSTGSTFRESRLSSSSRIPDSPPFRSGSRGAWRPTASAPRSRSQSRGFTPGHEYRHSESDLLTGNGGIKIPVTSSSGDYYHSSSTTTIPADLADESRPYREIDRSDEDQKLYDSLREREKEREKNKYGENPSQRNSWTGEEDYYRGMLGGQGGGPAGSGYDYKTYR